MAERIGIVRDNGVVVNVLVWADHTPEQLIADGITDFEEVTNQDVKPGIGWTYSEADGYRPPSPYASWVYNGVDWEAPTPKPEGDYLWNEETQTWDAVPTPTP